MSEPTPNPDEAGAPDNTSQPAPPAEETKRRRAMAWLQAHRREIALGALLLGLFSLLLIGFWRSRPGGEESEDEIAKREEEEQKEREEKEKEKPKPDFELPSLLVQPNDVPLGQAPQEGEAPMSRSVKPGHWTMASQDMLANNFDFVGELQTEVTNAAGESLPLAGMPYAMEAARPIALAKGQPKRLSWMFYIPTNVGTPWLSTSLRGRGGGEVLKASEVLNRMQPHQNHFVVLAASPERYKYLDKLDSIQAPGAQFSGPHYRVSRPPPDEAASLPTKGLAWTSTAYVLWDEYSPERLDFDQQQALTDWLHWGGQLIISGPDSLDLLGPSFLQPYLPATTWEATELAAGDVQPLFDTWTPADAIPQPLALARPWRGVKMQPHPDASFTPGTNELLLERPIGRGRVVVSAFPLDQREMLAWAGHDAFFNACLLRRPPRRFFNAGDLLGVGVEWIERARGSDPTLTSRVQHLTRGAGAGWDDFSPVSNAARDTLREASGIEAPSRGFVVKVLGAYLLALVPLNWTLFKLLGRVEWAWLAAPIVALVAAGFVIKLAQLDIGFARSQREVGVLECHAGYSRGELTRYVALYTSLSTTYSLHFADSSAAVQPFSRESGAQSTSRDSLATVKFREANDVGLEGLQVSSNSTAMTHSEEIQPLGQGITYDESATGTIRNGSPLLLRDAAVLREMSGFVETAWLGDLAAGESKALQFAPLPASGPIYPEWQKPAEDAAEELSAGSLWRLLAVAADPKALRGGGARLVAWTDQPLDGLKVEPAASQATQATLVVVHLRQSSLPDPEFDANWRGSIRVADQTIWPDEFEPELEGAGPP